MIFIIIIIIIIIITNGLLSQFIFSTDLLLCGLI